MSDDRTLMQTADIVPVASYDEEYREWKAAARNGQSHDAQHPIDELLGEHHIMDAALAAMERETRRLSVHHDLRPDAWEEIVDFAGNFIYQVHRRKEEQGLFPAFESTGVLSDATMDLVGNEHAHAATMTIDLVNGVSEGDWEKVLRAAHLYLRVSRDHLVHEERDLFDRVRGALSDDGVADLKRRFRELEKFGLGERDRLYYLDLARRMCDRAGLGDILAK